MWEGGGAIYDSQIANREGWVNRRVMGVILPFSEKIGRYSLFIIAVLL
jgi:hypothetical protein